MKNKLVGFLFGTLLILSTLTSCEDKEAAVADIRLANVTETVVSNGDFDVLEAAVVKANLATTLSGDGPFTVFAPTDAAFITYLGAANESAAITAVNGIDATVLANILQYHVVGQKIQANQLTNGAVTSLNGKSFTVDLTGFAKVTGTGNAGNASKVIIADIIVANGIIHAIDRVLIP
ncbi:MAG: fasciclin domain-containing protein [Verrucomicrobia bacterium]|nr:fasciclin domain-containing protein [Cytophagales bacterium]